MTNLRRDNQNDFVGFIRHNQPNPSPACGDLEDRIMDALEPRTPPKRRYINSLTIPHAMAITRRVPTKLLATGMLFTTVSFGVRTPRLAIEPHDLENFMVNSWHDTLNETNYIATEGNEAYWLLPTVTESPQALSVAAP